MKTTILWIDAERIETFRRYSIDKSDVLYIRRHEVDKYGRLQLLYAAAPANSDHLDRCRETLTSPDSYAQAVIVWA